MEGSLRAVNRTAPAESDASVGFNVFPRYRDSISESFSAAAMGMAAEDGSRIGRVQREISEFRWYRGF